LSVSHSFSTGLHAKEFELDVLTV